MDRYSIRVGIRLPASAQATNLFAWAIAAAPTYYPDRTRFGSVVCTSHGEGEEEEEQCYSGTCDFVACFVTNELQGEGGGEEAAALRLPAGASMPASTPASKAAAAPAVDPLLPAAGAYARKGSNPGLALL